MSTRDQQEREQGKSDDQGEMSHVLINWWLKCYKKYTVRFHAGRRKEKGRLFAKLGWI